MNVFVKHRSANGKQAFTLTELLVVLGVIAILGALFFNGLQSTGRTKVESVQCMNNQKQLIAAALLYADEFNGLWFPNETSDTPSQIDWVNNLMEFGDFITDSTNTAKLLDPQYSKLAPYINGNPKLFHCPCDQSYVTNWGFRVRSVSANAAVGTVWEAIGCLVVNGPVNGPWLGGANLGTGCQTAYFVYGKTSDFILPGPAMTWVFTDEHPDAIDDAELQVQMASFGIGAELAEPPGNYHNHSAPFAFADGHVEMHRWLGTTLGLAPIYWTGAPTGNGRIGSYTVVNAADNNDLIWIQQHTSAHR